MAKGSQSDGSNTLKVKYKVRDYFFTQMTICMEILFLVIFLLVAGGLYKISSNQVQQIIEISFIKQEQIWSTTIAQLKQNEMQMTSADLYGSAQSISDMITRPEIVDQAYLSAYRGDIENAFTFASGADAESVSDWDSALWYMAPNDDQYFRDLAQTVEGIDVCALSLPFTPEAQVDPGYTN